MLSTVGELCRQEIIGYNSEESVYNVNLAQCRIYLESSTGGSYAYSLATVMPLHHLRVHVCVLFIICG